MDNSTKKDIDVMEQDKQQDQSVPAKTEKKRNIIVRFVCGVGRGVKNMVVKTVKSKTGQIVVTVMAVGTAGYIEHKRGYERGFADGQNSIPATVAITEGDLEEEPVEDEPETDEVNVEDAEA